MRKSFLLFALLPLLLAGCARHYVMTLSSGNQITTAGKPRLQDGAFFYTDTKGQPGQISAARVREISPQSMAGESTTFKPTPTK